MARICRARTAAVAAGFGTSSSRWYSSPGRLGDHEGRPRRVPTRGIGRERVELVGPHAVGRLRRVFDQKNLQRCLWSPVLAQPEEDRAVFHVIRRLLAQPECGLLPDFQRRPALSALLPETIGGRLGFHEFQPLINLGRLADQRGEDHDRRNGHGGCRSEVRGRCSWLRERLRVVARRSQLEFQPRPFSAQFWREEGELDSAALGVAGPEGSDGDQDRHHRGRQSDLIGRKWSPPRGRYKVSRPTTNIVESASLSMKFFGKMGEISHPL